MRVDSQLQPLGNHLYLLGLDSLKQLNLSESIIALTEGSQTTDQGEALARSSRARRVI